MLYSCLEVKNPQETFTSCRDTAYARPEENPNSMLLCDLQQHWFNSWWKKAFPLLLSMHRDQCLPSTSLCQVFFLGQKQSVNVNISLHTTCSKMFLSLKQHHRCSLLIALQSNTWKTAQQLVSHCYFFQQFQSTLVCATLCSVGLEMQLLSRLLLWGLYALKWHQATYLGTPSAILQTLKATHNYLCCCSLCVHPRFQNTQEYDQ